MSINSRMGKVRTVFYDSKKIIRFIFCNVNRIAKNILFFGHF